MICSFTGDGEDEGEEGTGKAPRGRTSYGGGKEAESGKEVMKGIGWADDCSSLRGERSRRYGWRRCAKWQASRCSTEDTVFVRAHTKSL